MEEPSLMADRSEISPLRAWIIAARPRTLPAAVAPVVVGTALAVSEGAFSPLPALAALLGALLLQIGVNLANDYFDYVKGIDTGERLGPTRVAASGLIPLPRLRVGMILTFALAALAGVYLIRVAGWPILLIGLASILAALAYSGGPFPLASHGLGDLFVFVFFGLVAVGGTYYVQTLTFRPSVLVVATPVGTLITAILVVNNLRDIETDRRAGKHTLAVILGPRLARLEYVLLLAVAHLVPPVLWLIGEASPPILLPWLTLPLAVRLVRSLYRASDGPAFNQALARTAQLGLTFSLLFSLGLIVA